VEVLVAYSNPAEQVRELRAALGERYADPTKR
jgi:hypothetical protein